MCNTCGSKLYRYRKEGPGHLLKCFADGIIKDYTNGDLKCPNCSQEFARISEITGRKIHKIIQGKVYVKGNHGK